MLSVTLDKDTRLCISIAARPSSIGMAVHNAAFKARGVNFLYKSFAVTDVANAMAGVRALGIRGCSVSMPFKQTVIPLLDEVHPSAAAIGAVNTVVNADGRLVGYNTDEVGARAALGAIHVGPGDRILIMGAGGAARAVAFALAQIGAGAVTVSSRDQRRAAELSAPFGFQTVRWEDREEVPADVLINATPIGMTPNGNERPTTDQPVQRGRAVFDLVVTPLETEWIRRARAFGKEASPGYVMSLHQAAAQFELYTGANAPLDVMRESLETLLRVG